MCDPVSLALISGALSVSGGLAQRRTANKAIEGQNRANREAVLVSQQAADAERLRQNRFEEESTASLSRALQGSAEVSQGTGREAETTAALDEASDQVRPGLTVSALPGQISGDTELAKIIAGEINKSSKRVGTQVGGINTLAGLQGAFGGLGDLFGDTGSAIDTLNRNRRASLDVSGLETSIPAARVTPGSGLLGDLLSLGGQAVGAFGGSLGRPSAAPGLSPLPVPNPSRIGLLPAIPGRNPLMLPF